MPIRSRLLAAIVALLTGGTAWAQTPTGYLGVDLQDLTKAEAEKLGWEAPRGVKVVKPRKDGPATGAGLVPEDVIISLDGREVENMERFVGGRPSVTVTVRSRPARSSLSRTCAPAPLARMLAVPDIHFANSGMTRAIKGG